MLTVHCVQRGAKGELVQQVSLNDVSIINSDFDVHKTFRAAPQKWLDLRYGTKLLRQIPLLFCSGFSGFYQIHLPNSFKKSTFDEVWEREYDILDKTCMNKFRCSSDVNQWFLRQWQLAKNEFCPRSIGTGKSFSSDRYGKEDFDRAAQYISRQKGKMICINDGILTEKEFGYYSEMMRNAFDSILPDSAAVTANSRLPSALRISPPALWARYSSASSGMSTGDLSSAPRRAAALRLSLIHI